MVLSRMMDTAEAYIGESAKGTVVTATAYCNESHRQATKDADRIAELNVLRTIKQLFLYGALTQIKHSVFNTLGQRKHFGIA